MRVHRIQDWLIALLLIVSLALIGYGFLLWPGEVPYSPYSDILQAHLATKEVLFRSIWAGHGIPIWRSDQLSGGPALTNPQSTYTYPLHFLFYLFSPMKAVGWAIWLHLVIVHLRTISLGVLQSGRPAEAAAAAHQALRLDKKLLLPH
jgi:hypothetical protein